VRVAVIASPGAGRGRAAACRDAVLALLASQRIDAWLVPGDSAAAVVAAARESVTGGAEAVLAIGGDGTVHLAVQVVAGSGVPLGIVPAGTGNDFAVAAGVPADPLAAAAAFAGALAAGTRASLDAVRASAPGHPDRWWCTVLSAGFDAAVNERANRMRWPRGPRRYDLAILAELYRLRPMPVTITLDGEPWAGEVTLVAVGNAPTYGGGMRICPAADPADGLLDVTIAGPLSRRTLVALKPRLDVGTHVSHPAVTTRRAEVVEIAADPPGLTYADGERFLPTPVTMRVVPGALQLAISPAR
jgi:diacylglycerol kinase (ATP)